MAATGEYIIADLAEVFTVSRAAVCRTLQQSRPAGAAQATGSATHFGPGTALQFRAAHPARYR
jgi:hypothetical protein